MMEKEVKGEETGREHDGEEKWKNIRRTGEGEKRRAKEKKGKEKKRGREEKRKGER